MLISKEDPRFWDVRTRERRLRRGEMTQTELEARAAALPDVAEKATESKPLDEPDERAHERRMNLPYIRVTMPENDGSELDDLDDDDLDDEDDDDLDDDDDDDDK